jgi:hypothetical protein
VARRRGRVRTRLDERTGVQYLGLRAMYAFSAIAYETMPATAAGLANVRAKAAAGVTNLDPRGS